MIAIHTMLTAENLAYICILEDGIPLAFALLCAEEAKELGDELHALAKMAVKRNDLPVEQRHPAGLQ